MARNAAAAAVDANYYCCWTVGAVEAIGAPVAVDRTPKGEEEVMVDD